MGRNEARSGSRLATLGVCPSTTPDSRQPTWMIRANECASGRNSSVDAPGVSKMAGSQPCMTFRTSASRFPWLSSHPFGRPVVPEV